MAYNFIVLHQFGGPEVLEVASSDQLPEPGAGEVRFKVLASGVSFTDTLIRRGIYPDVRDKPPITPGYDMVGRVDKVGSGVTGLGEGQKVAALTVIGAYSEFMVLPAAQLVPVQEAVDDAESVCLVLSYVTAYQMLKRVAKVQEGDTILIHGAAGAVGTALLQIGALLQLKMYGTASSKDHQLLREYGCQPIDYKSEDFVEVLHEVEKAGVAAVFDSFGLAHFKRSLKVLGKGGKLVAFGSYHARSSMDLVKGFLQVQFWNVLPWMPSTTFYSIGAMRKKHPEWFQQDLQQLFQWLSEGKLKPGIARKMKLEEARAAHEMIEQGGVQGRIVLLMD
ncbi:MAG: zinc-binding dehydrogenase [Phaeodactylibacter sp.]|nr:zinc-binding dehydrogenase [Phaeodactylibacter sp.]